MRIRCKRFSPDTVRVAYADSRWRSYSLRETLDNLLSPLDLVWSGSDKITVQPYEYYRRTPAEGEKLLAWLSAQYADLESWERRRSMLLDGAKEALALDRFVRGLVADPDVQLGRRTKHDGYTTQNYALETLPGLYVCGTIYAPTNRGKHPLIVSPAGHWEGGRCRPDQQLRMASFARMGAVAVDMDILGWGDSERQIGHESHTTSYAMQLQVLWSKAVTDWIVASRRDIDTSRMAATGGSGGATHALLLALVDDRFAALAPVVHLVSHFDGGCPCESGRPVTLVGGGSCTPELLAAAMAPRPVLTVSDGGDWTASYPELEYPFLRRIWEFYGAGERVRNVHLPDQRHDYGPDKRRAVYEFFAEVLDLDLSQADESRVVLQPEEALQSFVAGLPAGAIRSREELERMIENLK
ncbi:MAG: acetylxylan esterase [Alistipes senegalensis]|nr:acetylxylan esterase [Alistipes senegalensis]